MKSFNFNVNIFEVNNKIYYITNFPIPIPIHITTIETNTNATLDCITISNFDLGLDWNERFPTVDVPESDACVSILPFD